MDIRKKARLFLSVVALIVVISSSSRSDEAPASVASGLDVPEAGTRLYQRQYRMGMHVHVIPGQGLRVHSYDPNGPAANMIRSDRPDIQGIIETNDLVTHANGVRIDSLGGFFAELGRFNGEATLTIVDQKSGDSFDWKVRPTPVIAPIINDNTTPSEQRTAHVVIAGLTDDANIGRFLAKNVDRLESIIKEGIPSSKLRLTVIRGADCNARTIIETIRRIPSDRDDAVVCYYLGHGAYDSNFAQGDPSGGHFFQIPGGDLLRKTLFDNVLNRPGRLKVLFSDTCNVASIANPVGIRERTYMETRTIDGPTPIEQLFLYHSGVIDVSASSRDQFSWFSDDVGGWFSNQFCNKIQSARNWNDFVRETGNSANLFFQTRRNLILNNPGNTRPETLNQIRGQQQMTPAVFRMEAVRDRSLPSGVQREYSIQGQATESFDP